MRRVTALALVGFASTLVLAAGNAQDAVLADMSGQWGRDMLFFEPPSAGPGPVVNAIRKADGSRDLKAPCCAIVVEGGWVGDYTNPILKPEAAEAVKTYRDLADKGTVIPDLHNTCSSEPPPFAMALQFGLNVLQQKGEVTLFYLLYNTVRHVPLNIPHPGKVTPSWQGNSVGWYEGDTLVIDTVGIKTAPFSTVDAFGTPHSKALHVVERYRLIDGAAAAEIQRQNGAIYRPNPPYGRGTIDPDTAKKGLQIVFSVEDDGVFTTRWTGQVTYRRLIGDWPEAVCAENPRFFGQNAAPPMADRPDF